MYENLTGLSATLCLIFDGVQGSSENFKPEGIEFLELLKDTAASFFFPESSPVEIGLIIQSLPLTKFKLL